MLTGAGVLRGARPALLLLTLASSSGAALWDEPQWRRLLHFKGRSSDARPEGFFLAPEGARSPRAELKALTRALDETPAGGEPARCRFPARTRWLAGRLGRDAEELLRPCRRFREWAELLDAEAVALVFASAYLSNPSSMFGHTFLRVERPGDQRLLDNTLNFAAETGEQSGVLFAVKGLAGLYPGKFTAMPYHMKALEYGNIEFRDLWEYRLALSPEEVRRLAEHAWEVGQAEFPYYFLSKNCSYQLMPFLEAAAPRLSLMPGTPPVVAPIDTLRAFLAAPGLVRETVYRPSHAAVLRRRRAALTRPERRAARAYAEGRLEEADGLAAPWPEPRRAAVLDAAQDLVLYRHGFNPAPPPAVRALERPLLVRRGRLPSAPEDPPRPAWAAPPEESHLRRRLLLGAGARRGGPFAELGWRPGYHAFADHGRGYLPGNAIESFSWRARYDGPTERAYLKDLRVIDIVSLTPFEGWTRKPSWTLGTGLDTAFELGRSPADSLVYDGRLATGLAAGDHDGTAVAGVLAGGEFAAGSALRTGARLGGLLGLKAGWESGALRAALEGGLAGYVLGDRRPNHRLSASVQWSFTRDAALRCELTLRGPHREGLLNAVLHH